jgi:alpha-beta hydrolase superfamily lysophospholipase
MNSVVRFARVGAAFVLVSLALPAVPTAAAGPAAPPRPLQAKCGDVYGLRAAPFWLTADDGIRLYAITAGRGPVTVVLAHESPADLCGWLPYVPSLTRAGVRVLAFDFRGMGDSGRPVGAAVQAYGRDFRAGVHWAKRHGAKHVFLMGASYGGALSLAWSPTLDIAGVISLSGEAWFPRLGFSALTQVRHLHAPLLIVGSRHDRYLPIPWALKLLRRAGSDDKRTAFYPGGFHGWDIVEDAPYAPKARALILAWIRAHAR